jgi:hypothetical protein
MFNHRLTVRAARYSCVLTTLAVIANPNVARADHGRPSRSSKPVSGPGSIDGISATRIVAPAGVMGALAAFATKVPAFSRQTGLACSSCHYQFPRLTPFGRLFKLNGYTLTSLVTIGQPGDSVGSELKLSPIPGLAAMLVGSVTHTSQAVPGTQNNTAGFPQQFSLFAAGQITPSVGGFTQLTYSAADGAIGIDNIDIRYANHLTFNDNPVIYGVTLHNNPTVQDIWNTVPAWGYPFMSSSSAPSPTAATLIEGALSQQVVGLGAYSLYNNMLYTEVTMYRSALQGAAMPLDSSATNVTKGVIPYWRIALQHEASNTSLMLGTYGFDAHIYPTGVTGLDNHYTDIAVDAQIEQRQGVAAWIGSANFIHERQQLAASVLAGGALNPTNTLSTVHANLAYLPNRRYSLSLGYFQSSGTTDALLYPSASVSGSANGSPNSSGAIAEVNYNGWQNTRLGLQYIAYNKFNGGSSAYDVPGGRSASANNTLYLFTWLAY